MGQTVADVLWEMLHRSFNGLMDARKERAPVIAIARDVESSLLDTSALEEMNPYEFFGAASLYTARLVNPAPDQLIAKQ